MRISPDDEHELGVLFSEILRVDETTLCVEQAGRYLGGCRRINSIISAREADFTPIYERLLREAAPAVGEAADEDVDEVSDPDPDHATDAAGDPEPPPPAPPPPPPDPPGPRESSKDRHKRLLRAKWLGFCKRFAGALHAGRLSQEHIDVLAGILDRTPPQIVSDLMHDEAALVLTAATCTPHQFVYRLHDAIARIRADAGVSELERQRIDSRAWMRIDGVTGLYHFGVVLDPLRGAMFDSAITQRMHALFNTPGATTGMSEAKVRLQAMLDLICGTATVIPELIILSDERTARRGAHPDSLVENIDGIRLPVPVATNACAVGNVTAAILNANGKVVASASCSRIATKAQRKLLRAMYRTCAHPDCAVPFSRCHIHHVDHWEHGGPTEIANLVPLCFEHHHLVHDGGWGLTIDAERTLSWFRPDGTLERTTALEPLLRAPTLRPVVDRPPDHADTTGPPPGRAPPTDTVEGNTRNDTRVPAAGNGATATATATVAAATSTPSTSTSEQAHLFDPHAA